MTGENDHFDTDRDHRSSVQRQLDRALRALTVIRDAQRNPNLPHEGWEVLAAGCKITALDALDAIAAMEGSLQ